MIDLIAVQGRLASWWFDYDQGDFDAWPRYFTTDAWFTCRSDSGASGYEEFIRADLRGGDRIVKWQTVHRRNSPYPLRHHGTNVHLTEVRQDEARFRSYLAVTHVANGMPANVPGGIVTGAVRQEDGTLRFSEMHVVLDVTDSVAFNEATELRQLRAAGA